MNPRNGKGSAPRKGRDQSKYAQNYDRIFKKNDDKKGNNNCEQADGSK